MTVEYIPPYQPCEPITCQMCARILPNKYYDTKLRYGPWANCCPSCYVTLGLPGYGTEFNRTTVGNWLKVKRIRSA